MLPTTSHVLDIAKIEERLGAPLGLLLVERWAEIQELVTALKPAFAEPVRTELTRRGVQLP